MPSHAVRFWEPGVLGIRPPQEFGRARGPFRGPGCVWWREPWMFSSSLAVAGKGRFLLGVVQQRLVH